MAFGLMEKWALMGAGAYQINSDNAGKRVDDKSILDIFEYTKVLKGPPYGDQERDQYMIKQGFRYYKEVYLKKYPH